MELSGNKSWSLMNCSNFSLPAFVLLKRIGFPIGFPCSSHIAASWFRCPISIRTKNNRITRSTKNSDRGSPLSSMDDIASCEKQKQCSIPLIHILAVENTRQFLKGRRSFKEFNYDLYLYAT